MIKLNDVEIKLDKYPDGTFLFKNLPPIGGWRRDNIEWFFESMEELTAVEYITRYCWDHRVVGKIYLYVTHCENNNVKQVWEELKKKGFAANNIVFGVGAFCFSAVIEPDGYMVVVTRDMFGMVKKLFILSIVNRCTKMDTNFTYLKMEFG